MKFMPRAIAMTSMGPCWLCGFDVLKILEMDSNGGRSLCLILRWVLMCGCGVEGRD